MRAKKTAAGIEVTYVAHATVVVRFGGAVVITDPHFGRRIAARRRQKDLVVGLEDLPPVDHVLISHAHVDHFHKRSLRRFGEDTVFITLKSLADLMEPGFKAKIVLIDWWQSHTERGVEVTAVPARHVSSGRVFVDTWHGACGFVVRGPEGSVFFAGDTAFGPHLAEIGGRFEIDVALLPIGPVNRAHRSLHMGPEDAVRAFRAIGAKLAIPYHFGTYRYTDRKGTAVTRFQEAAAQTDLADHVLVLEQGETRRVWPPDEGRAK